MAEIIVFPQVQGVGQDGKQIGIGEWWASVEGVSLPEGKRVAMVSAPCSLGATVIAIVRALAGGVELRSLRIIDLSEELVD